MTHVVGSDPPCRCLGCRRGLVGPPRGPRTGGLARRQGAARVDPRHRPLRRQPAASPTASAGGVSRRTYLPFALTVSLFSVALFLLFGGAALGLDWTVPVGTLALLLTAVAFVLQIFVVQFNRPRLLVPPSERDKPGRFGEARRRRKRRASGKPATDHEVEVLDARPPPDKPDSYTPYFVAICSDAECDWMSDPVGDERDPNPEAAVRRQAAEHSDRIAEGTRRPVG
jgi:hypothetical protein